LKITLAWVGKTKTPAIQALTDDFLKRISRYAEIAGVAVKDQAAILNLARGERQRERQKLVLLDSRGKQLSSEQLADFVEREQAQSLPLLFGIGGPDGFGEEARREAYLVLSLGPMTLPHEIARVVLLEQIYRAFTILNRHPYHLGH